MEQIKEQLTDLKLNIIRLEMEKAKYYVSAKELQELVDFHVTQLQKMGATLEDSICEKLRNLIEVDRIQKQIDESVENIYNIISTI